MNKFPCSLVVQASSSKDLSPICEFGRLVQETRLFKVFRLVITSKINMESFVEHRNESSLPEKEFSIFKKKRPRPSISLTEQELAGSTSDQEFDSLQKSRYLSITLDHMYSGAPPLFIKKNEKSANVIESVLDIRKKKLRYIQDMLHSQSSDLIICPKECHGNCIDVHHPLLIALLNSRDIEDKGEMKKRLVNLLKVISRYATTVKIAEPFIYM